MGTFEERIEDFVDRVGIASRNLAPIGMPIVGGLALLFAFYDGGSKILMTVGMSEVVATIVATFFGLIIIVLIEGMSLATMIVGDSVVDAGDKLQPEIGNKAMRNKEGMFTVTILLIACLESVPSAYLAIIGAMEWDTAIFRIGLIIFPFFSRIAASTFSINRLVRDHMAEAIKQRNLQRAQNRIEVTTSTRLKEEELLAEAKRREQEKDAKHDAKLQKIGVKSGVKSGVKFDTSTSGSDADFTQNFTQKGTGNKTQNRRQVLRDILHQEYQGAEAEALNKSLLAQRINASRPTLDTDLKALIEEGALVMNGHIWIKEEPAQ